MSNGLLHGLPYGQPRGRRRGVGSGRPGATAHVAASLVCALLSGCGVTLRAGRPTATPDDLLEVEERATLRCVHGMAGIEGAYRDELPGPVTDPELVSYLEPFEPVVRRTLVAAGLEPLLARLIRERERRRMGTGSTDALLAMRDELSAQMFALQTQLLAMEFEVDCTRALINAALSDYEEAETDRQLDLTIASLVVGAAVGIASAAWDIANSATPEPAWADGPLWTAITGAAATTAVGILVIAPPPGQIVYVHERNVLTPLVVGQDEAGLYPTFVFQLLTLPLPDGSASPRDALLASFDEMLLERVSEDQRALARDIVFGAGGIHDVRLLQLHQDLLEELGAALDALARDLDLLASAIAYVLREHAPLDEATPALDAPIDGGGSGGPGTVPGTLSP